MNNWLILAIGIALGWIIRGLVQYFNEKNS